MKKRLMIGLMAGGLLAAMLPGVAQAAPPEGNPNSPEVYVDVFCDTATEQNVGTWQVGPAGWAQYTAVAAFNYLYRDQCLPGTFTITITQVD